MAKVQTTSEKERNFRLTVHFATLLNTGTRLPASSDPRAECDNITIKKNTLITNNMVNRMRQMSCDADEEPFFLLEDI